jgi:hypothetical protein
LILSGDAICALRLKLFEPLQYELLFDSQQWAINHTVQFTGEMKGGAITLKNRNAGKKTTQVNDDREARRYGLPSANGIVVAVCAITDVTYSPPGKLPNK